MHAPLGALVVLTSPSTFLNIILLKATICSDLLIVQWHWSAALFLSLHVHLNNSSHIWLSDPGSTGVSNTGAELSTGKSRARTRGNREHFRHNYSESEELVSWSKSRPLGDFRCFSSEVILANSHQNLALFFKEKLKKRGILGSISHQNHPHTVAIRFLSH